MAKMSYVKPAASFRAIPLVVGGGTGCALQAESADYVCRVYDEDLGIYIFASGTLGCDYTPAEGYNVCYTVPVEDLNVYSS